MTELTQDSVSPDTQVVEAARLFVGIVFPRLMTGFTDQVQNNIDALKLLNQNNKNHKGGDKALKEHQDKLRKILSGEVQEKVFDKMVMLLAEVLTLDELRYAIFQEQITIKISGVASQLDVAFKEAMGED